MKKGCSIAIIVVLALLILGGIRSCNEKIFGTEEETTTTTETTQKVISKFTVVDSFIEKYNEISDVKIKDAKEIDITDKTDKYYRTEFRLSAFQDASSKIAKINNSTIEIIHYGNLHKNDLRLYICSDSQENLAKIIKNAIKTLYPETTDEELKEMYDYEGQFKNDATFLIGRLTCGTNMNNNEYCCMIDDNLSLFVKNITQN